MKQIFVRGPSRSGGTLIVTVLDAHPQVAMSYEIYEHLLEPRSDLPDTLSELGGQLGSALKGWSKRTTKVADRMQDRQLQVFVSRAARGGIEPQTLLTLVQQHAARGLTFNTYRERMGFMEALAVRKMECEGKRHWGVKIDSGFHHLHDLYPEAYFLLMKRDGRDIAASRKVIGTFDQSIEKMAKGWCNQVRKFREFAAKPGVRARMVDYERLTAEPEAELRDLMSFLDLPWDQRLLRFHDQDLTLYRNPMGHLSAKQVNKPINSSSVGRWKRDLTAEEIVAYEAVAGPLMAELGYPVSEAREVVQ